MKRPINYLAVLLIATVVSVGCSRQQTPPPEQTNSGQSSVRDSKLPEDHGAGDLPVGSDISPTRSPGKASVVYSKDYLINLLGLERLHPFDIMKYKKIHNQLLKDGLLTKQATHVPLKLSDEQILLVQSQKFLDSLNDRATVAFYLEASELKDIPVPLKSGVVDPFRFASGGTILAARMALKNGIGINIGGGYHHAKVDIGEGFCLFADVPIAIRVLQKEKLIERALVIDVDVHQGNGTAECLADDDSTFTFSIHQGNIYPIPKARSDMDVELDEGINDRQYMLALESQLSGLFEKANPDIVFIVGGCDTLAGDPLASFEMTHQGIVDRDAKIVDEAVKRNIPVVLTLAGGYSKDAWRSQYMSIKNLIETYGLAEK